MIVMWCAVLDIFLFKQKTAYEMRISDWSSDVCSSDLDRNSTGMSFGRDRSSLMRSFSTGISSGQGRRRARPVEPLHGADLFTVEHAEIGRASCRERVCQYV